MQKLKNLLKNLVNKIISKPTENYKSNKSGIGLYRNDDFRGFVVSRGKKNHFVIDYDLLYRVYNKQFPSVMVPDLNETQKMFDESDAKLKIAKQDWLNAGAPTFVGEHKKRLDNVRHKGPVPHMATEGELLKFIGHANTKSNRLKYGQTSRCNKINLKDYDNFKPSIKEYSTYIANCNFNSITPE